EAGWTRYGFPDAAGVVDIRDAPEARRGMWGIGAVHHLAWRVADDQDELAMRARIESAGARPTPVIDRFWFKSVYFKEPGGVLLRTPAGGGGFPVDDAAAPLGAPLVRPPGLEGHREPTQQSPPPLRLDTAAHAIGARRL